MTLPGTAGTPGRGRAAPRGAAHETGRLAVEMVDEDRRPSTDHDRAGRSATQSSRSPRSAAPRTRSSTSSPSPAGSACDLDTRRFRPRSVRSPAARRPGAGRAVPDGRLPPGRRAAGHLREVADMLDPEAMTATGRPLVDHLAGAQTWDRRVIRTRGRPLRDAAGIAVLRGSLAPMGPIIKPAAASPNLLQHRGRAVVFDSHRGLPRPHRRPRPRGRRGHRPGPAGMRAQGLSGDARGGQHAVAGEAARAGRPRHGPRLRRPDERDGIRHGRSARVTRSRGRWAAGPGSRRGLDHARRGGPSDRCCLYRRTSWPDAALRARCDRLRGATRGWERLYVDHVRRRTRGPISTSWWARAARSCQGNRIDLGAAGNARPHHARSAQV